MQLNRKTFSCTWDYVYNSSFISEKYLIGGKNNKLERGGEKNIEL